MRTSTYLASALFGSLAIAAPMNKYAKRALVTKTEVVIETQVVYVTVWDGQAPIAEATTTPGMFYEQPAQKSSSSQAEPTTTSSVFTPPAVKEPSSSSAAAPSTSSSSSSTPAPEPTSIYTPPSPTSVKEEPVYSSAPAPEFTTVAPVPSASPSPSPVPTPEEPKQPTGGNEFHGEVTVYDITGNGLGACSGIPLSNDGYTAAISHEQWGSDVWTHDGTYDINVNPWCGKKVTVTMNGKSITATIKDKCMGCAYGDIDLTRKAWNELTGGAGGMAGDRLKGSWTA